MLEFTQDPEWQRQREESWKALEEETKEGLTRKRVKEFKAVYMTGLIPDGVKIHPHDAIELFPDHSVEGIQYCLDVNFPEGLSDGEYLEVQRLLSAGLHRVKDLSRDEKVTLFRYVMGDRFDPERKFPFRIGQDQSLRTITIKPGRLYSSALIAIVHWIKRYEYCQPYPHWAELTEFMVSLILHASPKMFTFRAAIDRENRRKVQDRAQTTIEYTWKLFRYCISPPATIDDTIEGQQRKRFLEEFENEFKKLDEHPAELDKIWREIQIQEGVIKPNPAENLWRKLTRKGVPDGQ